MRQEQVEAFGNAINGIPDRLSRDVGFDDCQSEAAVVVADELLADLHRELSEFTQGMRDRISSMRSAFFG
ncbi:hypothetical protein [Pseudovibrio sp. Alg231-02]|uniref:hypothetical protein n=1 Tax=Pseudovibrio sp. Alg231-02 TaxID=1922223 RepID=UPI00131F3EA1|nr:hypothetical protein [Pseudovibrio sp. Alg231-02]